MADKIKELAELAGMATPAMYGDGFVYPEGMEKFAALIRAQMLADIIDTVIDEQFNVAVQWECQDGLHIWQKLNDRVGDKK